MKLEQWLGKDNTLGMDIWKKKYQQNNETFDEWLDRVSAGNKAIRQLIIEKKFLFGGRILANRGLWQNSRKLTYSNCYVIQPPEDNIESIFECASKLARTFSYGGGCGIDISKLSPRGALINNSAKETTGSVSFMELYNLVTSLIGQNGRRGALMLSLACDHPDLEEFISIKNDLNKITKANISIRVTDEFMRAVLEEKDFDLTFVRKETGEEIVKTVFAPDIFRQLCKNNWDFGEPGMLFWDTITNYNLLSNNPEFEFAGVNPCAEEPLPAGGSCLLGSINLAEFVSPEGEFYLEKFEYTVEEAIVALNEVLDEGLPLHPLEEQRKSVGDWRQIGLGIFGLADMLIKMGLKYGDLKSIDVCDMIGSSMIDIALRTSAKLAGKYGPYPKFNMELINNNYFYKANATWKTNVCVNEHGLRNSQLLTIAPTGSLSTMLGVSGGIEPIYDTHYIRKTESLHGHDEFYTVYTPIVERYMKENDIKDIKNLPEFFVTAKTLNPINRINMQATWQRYIDASISSTVNLPETATVEEVEELYLHAWKRNLKGLTIFRENCARLGILTSAEPKKEEPKKEEPVMEKICEFELDSLSPLTRHDLGCRLNGSTYVKQIACGHLYITINRDENDNLVEVFIDPGKSGGCSANAECIGRYASACMRSGMKILDIVDVTKGVKCDACTRVKGSKIKPIDGLSCGDVIARTIQEEYERFHKKEVQKKHYEAITKIEQKPKKILNVEEVTPDEMIEMINKCNETLKCNRILPIKSPMKKCPECDEELAFEGGCVVCKNCGFSKCD